MAQQQLTDEVRVSWTMKAHSFVNRLFVAMLLSACSCKQDGEGLPARRELGRSEWAPYWVLAGTAPKGAESVVGIFGERKDDHSQGRALIASINPRDGSLEAAVEVPGDTLSLSTACTIATTEGQAIAIVMSTGGEPWRQDCCALYSCKTGEEVWSFRSDDCDGRRFVDLVQVLDCDGDGIGDLALSCLPARAGAPVAVVLSGKTGKVVREFTITNSAGGSFPRITTLRRSSGKGERDTLFCLVLGDEGREEAASTFAWDLKGGQQVDAATLVRLPSSVGDCPETSMLGREVTSRSSEDGVFFVTHGVPGFASCVGRVAFASTSRERSALAIGAGGMMGHDSVRAALMEAGDSAGSFVIAATNVSTSGTRDAVELGLFSGIDGRLIRQSSGKIRNAFDESIVRLEPIQDVDGDERADLIVLIQDPWGHSRRMCAVSSGNLQVLW